MVMCFSIYLINRPQFPAKASMRKACCMCGNRGTFVIPIYGVLVLYWPLLAKFIVVQVKDIVPAFPVNFVGFPSLPVVQVRRVNDAARDGARFSPTTVPYGYLCVS